MLGITLGKKKPRFEPGQHSIAASIPFASTTSFFHGSPTAKDMNHPLTGFAALLAFRASMS